MLGVLKTAAVAPGTLPIGAEATRRLQVVATMVPVLRDTTDDSFVRSLTVVELSRLREALLQSGQLLARLPSESDHGQPSDFAPPRRLSFKEEMAAQAARQQIDFPFPEWLPLPPPWIRMRSRSQPEKWSSTTVNPWPSSTWKILILE